MCVINRNLSHVLRECHGQFARRVHISEKHVCDGISRLTASEPNIQDSRNILRLPLDGKRTSVEKDQYYRLAELKQFLKKRLLYVRDADITSGRALARHLRRFAERCHYHIAPASHLQRLIQQLLVGSGIPAKFAAEHSRAHLQIVIRAEIGPLGIQDVNVLSGHSLDSVHQSRALTVTGCYAPGTCHIFCRTGQWTHHSHRAFPFQRQHTVIFQEHVRISGNATGSGAKFVAAKQLGRFLLTAESVRVIEQAQFILGLQDSTASSVQFLHGHLTAFESRFGLRKKSFGNHIHIDSCLQRLYADLVEITHTVGHTFGYSSVVRDYESVPAPLVAQHVGKEPFVHGGRHVVYHVKGSHKATCSSICSRFVSCHIFVEHTLTGHVHSIVIPTCLGTAI